jgi:hypothetical protein
MNAPLTPGLNLSLSVLDAKGKLITPQPSDYLRGAMSLLQMALKAGDQKTQDQIIRELGYFVSRSASDY